MPLSLRDIESWTVRTVEQVAAGHPVEDSQVELKGDWPNPQRSARRIAGQANAARGQPTLWLIGVDEHAGVVGATYADLADWWNQVRAEFDGPVPVLTDISVVFSESVIVALQFDTTRSPYVVRNPVFGQPGGGGVKYEVPWREGTAIRSATHNDLILLMAPLQTVPFCEVVGGILILQERWGEQLREYVWTLVVRLFMSPELGQRIVLRDHSCEASFELPKRGIVNLTDFHTTVAWGTGVQQVAYGAYCEGPGIFNMSGQVNTAEMGEPGNRMEITIQLLPIKAERPIVVTATLDELGVDQNCVKRWSLKGYDIP